MNASGTLYIVATPIGNLEDITYRAVKVLQRTDYIAAEDTRRTRKLLSTYNISARLVSYHDHNKTRQALRIIKDLRAGKSVALVSDAGTPGISDPGYYLVNAAIREEIPIVPVPGPSAVIAALSASGLPTDRFAFEGYLPRKPAQRRRYIKSLKDEERTLIFYESPYRVIATLEDFLEVLGDRYLVVTRELTKVYEEIVRGLVSEVLQAWQDRPVRGEITLLVASTQHTKRISGSKTI